MQLVFVLLWTNLASIVPSKQDEGYFGRRRSSATRSSSFYSRSRRSSWGGSSDSSSSGRWLTPSRTSSANFGTRNSKYIPPESQESFNKKFRESVFSATSNGLIKTGPDTYVVRNGRTYFNHGSNVYYFGTDYNLRNVNSGTQMCRFVFDTDLRGDERTSENYLKHDSMGTIHGDAFRTSISEENFGEVKFENGARIRELSFECKQAQRCCQLQCCDQTYETLDGDDEKEKDGGFSLGFNIGIDFLIFIATLILLCLGMRIVAAIHSNMERTGWSSLTQRDLFRLGASQIQPWSRRMTQNSTPIQYPICPPNPQARIIRSSVPLSRISPSPDQTRQVNSQNPPPIYFEQSPIRSLSPNPDENVTYDDPPPMYIEPPPSYEDCVSQK